MGATSGPASVGGYRADQFAARPADGSDRLLRTELDRVEARCPLPDTASDWRCCLAEEAHLRWQLHRDYPRLSHVPAQAVVAQVRRHEAVATRLTELGLPRSGAELAVRMADEIAQAAARVRPTRERTPYQELGDRLAVLLDGIAALDEEATDPEDAGTTAVVLTGGWSQRPIENADSRSWRE